MDRGLFAKDLARIIGVTEQTILNWETGKIKKIQQKQHMEGLINLLPKLKAIVSSQL